MFLLLIAQGDARPLIKQAQINLVLRPSQLRNQSEAESQCWQQAERALSAKGMFDHEVTSYKMSRKYPRAQRYVTVIFHIFTACTANFGKQYFQKKKKM